MKMTLQAACGCLTGRVRKKNEDNFYFDGYCLEQVHGDLKFGLELRSSLKNRRFFGVFDGMGGENFGEVASYAAARRMQVIQQQADKTDLPREKYLAQLVQRLDEAVVEEQAAHFTQRMGTTMVGLCFWDQSVFVCNVGDSRAYRLRGGELEQLSHDHSMKLPGRDHRKAPLTQHLGFGGNDILIDPYMVTYNVEKDDIYLICSDGLTDMLEDPDIARILKDHPSAPAAVEALLESALSNGGRDNVTAIVCALR